MNDTDWARLSLLIGRCWPGAWTAEDSDAYRIALDGFDPQHVLTAVERRMRSSARFRPSVAEIIGEITGATRGEHVAPDEAWTLVEQAIRRVGCSRYDQRFAVQHQAAIDWLATQDRAVAAWAARRGLCQIEGSLGQEPVNGDNGGIVRAALRRDYRDLVTEITERQLEGGEGVPDSMLICRRTNRVDTGGMHDLLERLRPAAELKSGEAA